MPGPVVRLDTRNLIPARFIDSADVADQITAADLLAKLLTVDGAGSGLDADLLDGQSAAAFAAAGSGLTKLTSTATPTTFESSTAEVDIFTYSISGAAAGDVYRLVLGGDYLNFSGSASTGIFKVKLGATTIATATATSWNSGAQRREWRMEVDLVVGTLTQQSVSAWVTQAAATADNWPMATTAAGAAPGYGTATENLATAKTLAITHQHSVNNSDTEIVVGNACLTRLR